MHRKIVINIHAEGESLDAFKKQIKDVEDNRPVPLRKPQTRMVSVTSQESLAKAVGVIRMAYASEKYSGDNVQVEVNEFPAIKTPDPVDPPEGGSEEDEGSEDETNTEGEAEKAEEADPKEEASDPEPEKEEEKPAAPKKKAAKKKAK